LNLQAFDSTPAILQNRDEFEKIVRRLKAGEMPPKGAPRPSEEAVTSAVSFIESEFDREDLNIKPEPRVLARRLNRTEYNNAVRDLLGVRSAPADGFPPDDSALGFDNIAQAMSISPTLMEKYLATAERVAREAVFGAPVKKNEVTSFNPTLPRRLEVDGLNHLKVVPLPYYSMSDYDVTGLSHSGSFHLTHQFPVDGDYVIRVVGAGFRPAGSDPGQMDFWFDGKLVKSFPVNDAFNSGFERRPDQWEIPLKISAGPHDLIVAYPRQFEGLPAVYGGPNPSKTVVDPCASRGGGAGNAGANAGGGNAGGGGNGGNARGGPCLADLLKQPPDPDPVKEQARLAAIERAKAAPPPAPREYEGLAVHELDILWPTDYPQRPSAESVSKVFICGSPTGPYDARCEKKILTNLASRAYRRPATNQEVDELVAVAAGARKRGSSYQEGLSLAIATMLASPNFLFRIDKSADARTEATAQYELASRLSFFLWSSLPDDELLRAAEQGVLRKPDVLDAQVRRMIANPKSQAFVENFADQWLEVRRLESVQPDRERYPDFDDYLRDSMKKETELFFQYIMQQDRPISEFIDGPYSFLNERLARHYGIRGVTGPEFRKVDLTAAGRAGILTQGGVLTVTSYANRTSVVQRGKWVLENILNAPPPPPPPNVPTLNEEAIGADASLRQQMEQHRKNPVCAGCHARMDPLGFGLENYDAVGAWRTKDGNFPIDSSGTLPDGRTFQGAVGLTGVLKRDQNAFAEGLTEKVMTYALGRAIERTDRPTVRQVVARVASSNYKLSSLILGVVNSVQFQMPSERQGK
jgi:hypothetical protein